MKVSAVKTRMEYSFWKSARVKTKVFCEIWEIPEKSWKSGTYYFGGPNLLDNPDDLPTIAAKWPRHVLNLTQTGKFSIMFRMKHSQQVCFQINTVESYHPGLVDVDGPGITHFCRRFQEVGSLRAWAIESHESVALVMRDLARSARKKNRDPIKKWKTIKK